MAKDDYFVITYKILSYLYACMKAGETPDLSYLHYDTEDFPVCRAYWNDIFSNLIEEGYIRGRCSSVRTRTYNVFNKAYRKAQDNTCRHSIHTGKQHNAAS